MNKLFKHLPTVEQWKNFDIQAKQKSYLAIFSMDITGEQKIKLIEELSRISGEAKDKEIDDPIHTLTLEHGAAADDYRKPQMIIFPNDGDDDYAPSV